MRSAIKFILCLLTTCLLLSACGSLNTSVPPTEQPSQAVMVSPFVSVQNGQFYLEGQVYRFVGTNFWQGMNLGMDTPDGNRDLLLDNLDLMQQLSITNLRVMASSEGPNTEPYRMVPALMVSPGVYDEAVLDGLDYLLAELGKRDMKAVMVLNNYWQWSGGMGQYVSWHEATPIPFPGDWGRFMDYVAGFYACQECQVWYQSHIAMLVSHVNPYNGLAYRDDPVIFAWELANEPRRYPESWIDSTAAYIKSLDPNHMVTTGSEGTPPGERMDFIEAHNGLNIDYTTIHIWPQNWGWYDPRNAEATYPAAEAQAIMYFQNHARDAASLGKPLVLEEFGLARDWLPLQDPFNPRSPVTYRDKFYSALFDQVLLSMADAGAAAGDNFWAFAGAARPGYAWVGDPPHETPGWYSVYDIDATTLAIIKDHAASVAGTTK